MKKRMPNKRYFCLHSHFYQPPRENAWTGKVEMQESASPYHDWNERIYQECYLPNTKAEIVNSFGLTEKTVNNFRYMNFDVGTDLMLWMRENHPDTLEKIIEADKQSVSDYGFGNAIAMAYNHIIMPLADNEDKKTQIRWAAKAFEYFFGRKTEGLWLPETACSLDTIDILIEEGIKYIILDPSQAMKAHIDNEWVDVSDGSINTLKPYFCRHSKGDESINIFFYNGALSKALAFDDIVFDSSELVKSINSYYRTAEKGLVLSATDGETFGHHKPYSERTLAYMFDELLGRNQIAVINLSSFLAKFPPQEEVKIKNGISGAGTSWSCIHGTSRWSDDCGCHTGGEFGWNQKWRKPLREAMNLLNKELKNIYLAEGKKYFKDVWEARNNYIHLILETSYENTEKFFYFNALKYLNEDESLAAIKLLEMQKFALLMYTSCAWFFSDIGGIETIQVLQYAARAIEIANELGYDASEEEFLAILKTAESNDSAKGTGVDVYNKAANNVERF